MFCKNCGKEIQDNVKFCKYCGFNFTGTELKKKEIKVIFHRKKSFVGCLVQMNIHIDKKVVGYLNNNGSFEINIPYGEHNVILEMWSGLTEKNIVFSEEYSKCYIDVVPKMGLITGKVEFSDIRFEK